MSLSSSITLSSGFFEDPYTVRLGESKSGFEVQGSLLHPLRHNALWLRGPCSAPGHRYRNKPRKYSTHAGKALPTEWLKRLQAYEFMIKFNGGRRLNPGSRRPLPILVNYPVQSAAVVRFMLREHMMQAKACHRRNFAIEQLLIYNHLEIACGARLNGTLGCGPHSARA